MCRLRRAGGTGELDFEGNTNHVIDAVNLPELTERKNLIDNCYCTAGGHQGEEKERMSGGGNDRNELMAATAATRKEPPRHIMYGATELLTGAEFVEQLSTLGHKMGSGSRKQVTISW